MIGVATTSTAHRERALLNRRQVSRQVELMTMIKREETDPRLR
jgi:hypothetical protein